MTLRKLLWMANARREHEHDVAIQTICHLGASFAGKFRPNSANPYRNVERVRTAAERDEESKEGWDLLKAGLASMAKVRGK